MVQLKDRPSWGQPRDYGCINIRPWRLDNPCLDFLSAKAPIHRQGVSSRHPNTAVQHVLLKACGLTSSDIQANFKYAALFPSFLMQAQSWVMQVFTRSASCSILLNCCCSQKMLYYSRNNAKNVLPLQKHLHLVSKPCGFLSLWVSRVKHINTTWLMRMT